MLHWLLYRSFVVAVSVSSRLVGSVVFDDRSVAKCPQLASRVARCIVGCATEVFPLNFEGLTCITYVHA